MKIRILLLFCGFAMTLSTLPAQKTVREEQQLWLAVSSQTRLSEKWGIWADFHYRMRDHFIENPTLLVGRMGATYYLNEAVRLTAGYAYFHHLPADGHKNIAQPEHRPWQQIQWFTRWPKLQLAQWLRLEERFRHKILDDDHLAEGYHFNWRMRYNFTASVPLGKKRFEPGGLLLVLGQELMANFGKTIVYNHFDQSRLSASFAYQISEQAQFSVGYTYIYLQLSSGDAFSKQHLIRVSYAHNFDWRKESKN